METPAPWDIGSLGAWVSTRAADYGDRPVMLAGHLTGRAIALAAALLHPGRVDGPMLSGTAANMDSHGHIAAVLDRVNSDWVEAFSDALVARSFFWGPPEPLLAAALAYARAARREVVLEVLTSQRATDLEPRLTDLNLPVAVVHGRDETARPLEHGQRLTLALPRAELTVLDTGHRQGVDGGRPRGLCRRGRPAPGPVGPGD